jgi:hypothetical protein
MKTADQLTIADFKPGITRCRIVDPNHQFSGRSGTLEFTTSGAAWLRVMVAGKPVDVHIALKHLAVLPVHDVGMPERVAAKLMPFAASLYQSRSKEPQQC